MNTIRLSMLGTWMMVICLLGMSASLATAEEPTAQPAARVELTQVQKNEIATLNKEIQAKKTQLINKYVEYGLVTEDEGKRIISHMEERYKKLEENGYIPRVHEHHGHKHKGHHMHH